MPVFGAVLKVVNLVRGFSPVDDLSTGHSITWGQLARAVGQIVLLMGGIFGLAGILFSTAANWPPSSPTPDLAAWTALPSRI